MPPIKALALVGGPYHDKPGARDELTAALEAYADVDLTLTDDLSVLASPRLADFEIVIVYTTGARLAEAESAALAEFISGGKGLFGLHGATTSLEESALNKESALYLDMLGSKFLRHPPYAEVRVTISDPAHSITRGVSDFVVPDELYVLECDRSKVHVLATAQLGDEVQPSAYTKAWGAGRVFYLGLGHDEASLRSEPFRRLAGQGLVWAARG